MDANVTLAHQLSVLKRTHHEGGGDGPHARLEEDGDHAEELLTVKQQHDHVSNNHFSFQMVATDRESCSLHNGVCVHMATRALAATK